MASRRRASACCSRSWATNLFIFCSNGSASSSAARYARTLACPRHEGRGDAGRAPRDQTAPRQLAPAAFGVRVGVQGPRHACWETAPVTIVLQMLKNKRADERTQTAFLL